MITSSRFQRNKDSEKPTAGGGEGGEWGGGRGGGRGAGTDQGRLASEPILSDIVHCPGCRQGPGHTAASRCQALRSAWPAPPILQAKTPLTFQPELIVPLPPTMLRPFSCYLSRFRPRYHTGFPFSSQPVECPFPGREDFVHC